MRAARSNWVGTDRFSALCGPGLCTQVQRGDHARLAPESGLLRSISVRHGRLASRLDRFQGACWLPTITTQRLARQSIAVCKATPLALSLSSPSRARHPTRIVPRRPIAQAVQEKVEQPASLVALLGRTGSQGDPTDAGHDVGGVDIAP